MDDKQDGTWNYKIMIFYYNIYLVTIDASRMQHGEGQRVWRYDQLHYSSLSQCFI